MLRIGKLTDYATGLMAQLAHAPERNVSAQQLAFELGLPGPTVGALLKRLGRAGLVRSVRGAAGGYGLARAPEAISVADIISAIEGPRSELLAGMMKTAGEAFSVVDLFAVNGMGDHAQNVLVLGGDENWSKAFTETAYVSGSAHDAIARCFVPPSRWPVNGVVFTDDHNPVDAIIARGLWAE